MSSINIIKETLKYWESNFSNVPWIDQNLFIDIHHQIEKIESWKIYIQGGSGSYNIVPLDHEKNEIDPKNYELSWDQTDVAIILKPLDHCASISALRIQQINSPQVANILCIEKPQNSNESVVIFNSKTNDLELIEKITERLHRQPEKITTPLLSFLKLLINSDFANLLKLIETHSQLQERVSALNSFLSRYQLEYNAHGLKKTFRHWSSFERSTYLAEVSQLMNHLEQLTPEKVSLGFGAVLGKFRENSLIAHDDDLDVIVGFELEKIPDIASALSAIEQHLSNTPWNVQGKFFSHLWVGLPCGYRVDVFVGLVEDSQKISFYPSKRRNLELKNVYPPIITSLEGVDLPFPAEPHIYLENTYGSEWKKPLVAFSHPWDRSEYSDIAGAHSSKTMVTRGELMTQRRKLTKTTARTI